ncbi:MAG: ParB/RepB/Spo0J family partition protein [Ruminococcaceae bacterium]|nr:ParB/RepB/Spo0J family partition protein [Oscillospiraceae bacterium]
MFNQKIKSPVNIPVSKIHPFEGNPYKVLDNEEMNFLIESIQQQGIISPVVVRPLENTKDEYEVISGHRRLRASVKAGLETVPAFIYAINRDEAAIMLVDSNLHREHILPSEKAFAYKLKLEAMKHQGITCGQVGHKSRDEISDTDSGRQIQRYIRLTYLIPELLDLVDEEKIALTPAVELSYLTDEEQYALLGVIEVEDRTPSLSQAVRFKKLSQAGNLSDDDIETIMQEDKANQKPMFKVSMEKLQKVAPKIKDKDFESFVLKACEHYYRYLLRQRDRDSR